MATNKWIGNLPTEKVTKRDLFHVFHKHGKLAQISIKQAYGFVQFLEAVSCYQALTAEQGEIIRGRKIRQLPRFAFLETLIDQSQISRFPNLGGTQLLRKCKSLLCRLMNMRRSP
jgi:hypothetical protein